MHLICKSISHYFIFTICRLVNYALLKNTYNCIDKIFTSDWLTVCDYFVLFFWFFSGNEKCLPPNKSFAFALQSFARCKELRCWEITSYFAVAEPWKLFVVSLTNICVYFLRWRINFNFHSGCYEWAVVVDWAKVWRVI